MVARVTLPRLAAGAMACLLAGAFTGAAGVPTVDEMAALLKAGVGEGVVLKQVRASGARLDLTARDLLALKAAGASDSLLEALMEDPGSEEPFRIFSSVNERGETVLHVTNLDERGRRIGGEVPDPSPFNVVAPSRQAEASEPRRDDYDDDSGGGYEAAQPPVVVNVYPPEPAAPSYGPAYSGGLYPGYLAGYPARHVHGRGCGHFANRLAWWLSPPGSYTHFLTHHHGAAPPASVLSPGRPALIDTRPFRAGTAAARNRARFRH